MKSDELKRAKRDVRRAVLAERDAMSSGERARRGARVVDRFLALPEVAAARTVMAFWSFGSEVPTRPLLDALHDRGVRVVLPRVVAGDLELRTWRPGDPMTATSFGAMEPAGGEVVAPGEPDVICTPAVAFDRRGRRVGYGGGFYDRLLPYARPDAPRVGIAFDLQLAGGDLPAAHFDRPVDVLVTESEVLRWSRP
jgi:5-formyltetrahydrofolate cyclo-ligase